MGPSTGPRPASSTPRTHSVGLLVSSVVRAVGSMGWIACGQGE